MPGTKKYLIYVIEPFGDDERRKAEQFRAKSNLAHFRNARRFEFESCDGVVLGKGVAKRYPAIAEAYQKENIPVEDLDASFDKSDDAVESEPETIKPEPSDNIYEWTRSECFDWLDARHIDIPGGRRASKSDLQSLVLEHMNDA